MRTPSVFLLAIIAAVGSCVEAPDMPQRKIIPVTFPVGGIDRSLAYQTQPPYTTPDAVNVRARGSSTERGRGGSRPGFASAYVGGWTPSSVMMMQTVRPLAGTLFRQYYDDFSGTAVGGDVFGGGELPGWYAANHLKVFEADAGTGARRWATSTAAFVTGNSVSSTLLNAMTIDTTQAYSASVEFMAEDNENEDVISGNLYIFMGVSNSSPSHTNCLEVILSENAISGGTRTASMAIKRDAITTLDSDSSVPILLGLNTLTVSINGTSVKAYINGTEALSGTIPGGSPLAGSRIGVGVINYENSGGPVGFTPIWLSAVSVNYQTTAASGVVYDQNKLIACEGGSLLAETSSGSMAVIASSNVFTSTTRMQAAEYAGKLYVADYSTPVRTATGATITNGAGAAGYILSDSTGGLDFTALGISATTHAVVVTSAVLAGGGPVTPSGTYRIASGGGSITTSTITLDSTTTGYATPLSQSSAVAYTIIRAPKVYDPATGAVSLWTQKTNATRPYGVSPTGCPLVCAYRNRMVMAGPGSVYYMSRVGDPDDWDPGADPDDPAKALVGANLEQGVISRRITALIPFRDDSLIFGCDNELWIVRGDPGYGGSAQNLSRSIGVLGATAWCHTPHGSAVILDTTGLYEIGPDGSIIPISRLKLPRDLTELDTSTYYPVLAWDDEVPGFHVFCSRISGSTGISGAPHWTFDYDRKAFFRMELWGESEPYAVVHHKAPGCTGNVLLMGTYTGDIGRFSYSASSDNGGAITSSVLLGPFRSGPADVDSVLQYLTGILSSGSGTVTWNVYSGESAEGAYQNYIDGTKAETGTLSAGRNTKAPVRVRGQAFLVELTSTARWELEELTMAMDAAGPYKAP